jgi:GGDEF domain-containing protein
MKNNERVFHESITRTKQHIQTIAFILVFLLFSIFHIGTLFAQEKNLQEKSLLRHADFQTQLKQIIEAEINAPIEYYAMTTDEYNSDDVFFCDIFECGGINHVPDSEKDDFLVSLPYTWDYGVVISRNTEGDTLDNHSNLKEKKYITINGISSLEKFMIANKQKISYNRTTDTSPFNSFSKIFKGEADFTILPNAVAEYLLVSTGMKNELAVTGSPEDTIMIVNYRFAVRKSDRLTLIKINDVINKLCKSKVLLDLAKNNNLPVQFIPNYDANADIRQSTALYTVNTITFILTVLLFIASFYMSKKKHSLRKRQDLEAQEEELEKLELKRKIDEYIAGKVTLTEQTLKDPYSGLFRMDYLKDRISEEISRYNNFEQVFSIALLTISEKASLTEKNLKESGEMVLEDFSKDCICGYNGDATFVILFPKRTKYDIQIFAEGAAEHLERILDCTVETDVIEYGTMSQNDFMERLCSR